MFEKIEKLVKPALTTFKSSFSASPKTPNHLDEINE